MFMMLIAFAGSTFAAGKEKVRVGYWTSGISLGYGAVLEETRILEKNGVDVEYVRFPDLLAQIQALSTGDIDVAYAAPMTAVFGAINDGVPIKIIAATQLADAVVVAPANSPVKTWSDLKGKKVGASKPNEATTVIAATIADQVYGVKSSEYSIISGNEGRLAQFLAQDQIDAAVIRTFTYDQIGKKLNLRKLGELPNEWKAVSGNNVPPYLAVGIARADYLKQHPEVVAKVVKSWINLDKWGSAHKQEVIDIVIKRAGMTPENAGIYVNRWKNAYRVSLDDKVLKTLKSEHDAFARIGLVKGRFTKDIYDQEPYLKAAGKK